MYYLWILHTYFSGITYHRAHSNFVGHATSDKAPRLDNLLTSSQRLNLQ